MMNGLTYDKIYEKINNKDISLFVFDEIGSTNDFAKELDIEKALVVANCQTAGRGRLGRSFSSPKGTGLYMTLVLQTPVDSGLLTTATLKAAVAVRRALLSVAGVDTSIKWVNDIFYMNRKVCGILAEYSGGKLLIGIGVNCFPGSFPEELSDIAGAVCSDTDRFDRSELAAEICDKLLELLLNPTDDWLEEYRKSCFVLGREILVSPHFNSESLRARALDISDDGGLLVEYTEIGRAGQQEILTTGEVSIRTKP